MENERDPEEQNQFWDAVDQAMNRDGDTLRQEYALYEGANLDGLDLDDRPRSAVQ